MYTLKVVTTVLIVFMMLIIFCFVKGKMDKPTIVGFGFMELVYILSDVASSGNVPTAMGNSYLSDVTYIYN